MAEQMPEPAAPPSENWPIWDYGDGYAVLAQYVSFKALNGHGLSLRRQDLPGPDDAASVVAALYARLQARGFGFHDAEWTPARQGQQPVRHPGWIASEGGNCLDLSAMFAAMCLRTGVAPLLAVTGDHAFVLVRRGLARGAARFVLDGAAEEQEDGVLVVRTPVALRAAIDAGELIAVDCVAAALGLTWEQAQERALGHADRELRLVDVPWQQGEGGIDQLEPPLSWPSVHRYPPVLSPGEDRTLLSTQADALAEIEALPVEGGLRVVLLGDTGLGKSTVARALLAKVSNDAAWFLDASDLQALMDSLAEAELNERGVDATFDTDAPLGDAGDYERPDREGFALAALDRLRRVTTPWTVVLDNADGDPSRLTRLIPQPGPGQLVLVTTTNPQWRGHVAIPPVELQPAEQPEVAERVGDAEVARRVGGSALLLNAFSRLVGSGRVAAADVAALPVRDDDEARASQYWELLSAKLAPRLQLLAGLAAFLPPDRIPEQLLERLAEEPGGVAGLCADGLLDRNGDGSTVRLHRLLGRAVREALGDGEDGGPTAREIALRIAGDAEACALLSTHGDRGMAERLLAPLPERPADAAALEAVINALANLAEVLEMRGDSAGCAAAHATVLELIDDRPEHRRYRAEALFTQARVANRNAKDDEAWLRRGLAQAEEAYAIADELGLPLGRFLAMVGLLQKQFRKFPIDGAPAPVERLETARLTLEHAYALRADLPELHPERVRGFFNLAGVRIPLARHDIANAAEHLAVAHRVYSTVASQRRTIFRCEYHAQIAICIQGLALVDYYSAVLVTTDPAQRSAALRDATRHVLQAMEHWEAIEDDEDRSESMKAARLLAKISYARYAHGNIATVGAITDDEERKTAITRLFRPVTDELVDEISDGLASG
jgi:hypothetical protein